jgi:hypothetical protein
MENINNPEEYTQLMNLLNTVKNAQAELSVYENLEDDPNKVRAQKLLELFHGIEAELNTIKETLEALWDAAYKHNNTQVKDLTRHKLTIVEDLTKRVRACRFNINFYIL